MRRGIKGLSEMLPLLRRLLKWVYGLMVVRGPQTAFLGEDRGRFGGRGRRGPGSRRWLSNDIFWGIEEIVICWCPNLWPYQTAFHKAIILGATNIRAPYRRLFGTLIAISVDKVVAGL